MLRQHLPHEISSQSNERRLASILSFSMNILKQFASYTSIHGLEKLVDDFTYLNRSSVQATLSKRLKIFVSFSLLPNITHSNCRFFTILCRKIYLAKSVAFVFWGGAFLIGIIVLCIMGNLVLQRSNKTPTLTTIDTYYHRIHDVSFPAITFCNLNVVHRSSFQPVVDRL